jgi:hypothetical protein
MNPAESSWPQYPDNPPPDGPPSPGPAAHAPAVAQPAQPPPFLRKNPRLAGLLSLFPGLGNVYNGLYLRGLIEFLIVGSLMGLADKADSPFYVMTMFFFWAFSILDAYRQAVLINYGYTQDLGLFDQPQRPKAGQGGLVAGILLTVLGVIAFLEEFVEIDLRWLYDLWPLLLVAIGVWLVVASLRERRKAAPTDSL